MFDSGRDLKLSDGGKNMAYGRSNEGEHNSHLRRNDYGKWGGGECLKQLTEKKKLLRKRTLRIHDVGEGERVA